MNTTYRITEDGTVWIIVDQGDGTSSIQEVSIEADDYAYWYELAIKNES